MFLLQAILSMGLGLFGWIFFLWLSSYKELSDSSDSYILPQKQNFKV